MIYRPITCNNETNILQSDLEEWCRVEEWCRKWLMSLNVSKTVLIAFHRRQNYVTQHAAGMSLIFNASSFKYHGLTLTGNLSWTSDIVRITNEANCVLGYLRRSMRLSSPSVQTQAYLILVCPKLEYACAIWDPHLSDLSKALESIQNCAARFIYSDFLFALSLV